MIQTGFLRLGIFPSQSHCWDWDPIPWEKVGWDFFGINLSQKNPIPKIPKVYDTIPFFSRVKNVGLMEEKRVGTEK